MSIDADIFITVILGFWAAWLLKFIFGCVLAIFLYLIFGAKRK